MADLNITLEEFDAIRNERDIALEEIKQLKEYIQGLENKSRVIVTRYDRVIPSGAIDEMCEILANQIWDQKRFSNNGFISQDPWGNPTIFDPFGVDAISVDPENLMIRKCIDRVVKPFIQKYVNTQEKKSVVTRTSTIKNFDDVVGEIKQLYDTQFALEYSKKEEEIKVKEQEAILKVADADKQSNDILTKAKKKLAEAEAKYNKAEKQVQDIITNLKSDLDSAKETIKDKIQEIADLNADIKYFDKKISERDKTITEKEKAIESLNSELDIYKETVANQKDKLDAIFRTWWWKIFG